MLEPEAPVTFEKLITLLSKLPAIGNKSAMRLATFIAKTDEDYVFDLANTIINFKKSIKYCRICGNYTFNNLCSFCEDIKRDKEIICVIEEPIDIQNIEKTGIFKGVYHILNGVISIAKGKTPDDLRIKELLERIQKNPPKEVIIATNPTLDGETTALYLKNKITEFNNNIKVSRLAVGLPSGSIIEYADKETLQRAFDHRIVL